MALARVTKTHPIVQQRDVLHAQDESVAVASRLLDATATNKKSFCCGATVQAVVDELQRLGPVDIDQNGHPPPGRVVDPHFLQQCIQIRVVALEVRFDLLHRAEDVEQNLATEVSRAGTGPSKALNLPYFRFYYETVKCSCPSGREPM